MKALQLLVITIMLIFTQGCVNNYEKFYKPQERTVIEISKNPQDFALLVKDIDPRIEYVNESNKKDKFEQLKSSGWVAIGESAFLGGVDNDPKKHMIEHAKKIGATLVIAINNYKGTETVTKTTQEANNINTNYFGLYGQSIGNALTTYYTPKTTVSSYDKYQQNAVFLIKRTKKQKFGLQITDLTPKLRREIGRNTGVLVNIVFDGSPAFYANIMKGDIILKMDGVDARGGKELNRLMTQLDPSIKSLVFTILRNGKELDIVIKF